jgi:hypothetical protein
MKIDIHDKATLWAQEILALIIGMFGLVTAMMGFGSFLRWPSVPLFTYLVSEEGYKMIIFALLAQISGVISMLFALQLHKYTKAKRLE